MGLETSPSKWLLQILLNLTMLMTGFVVAMRGTSLVQLADIYSTDLSVMGLAIATSGIGGPLACNTVGFVLKRFPSHEHTILSIFLLASAVGTWVMPFGHFVEVFCVANFVFGLGYASNVLANTLSLRLWRMSAWGAGPFVHSLFLFFLIGLLSAPIICTPFFSRDSYQPDVQHNESTDILKHTVPIGLLSVPYIASGIIFFILGLLALKTGSVMNERESSMEVSQHIDMRLSEEERMPSSYYWKRRTLVCIIGIFYIGNYTMIMAISNFLIPALTNCSLKLSYAQGALIISIFFMGQAIIAAVNSIISRWLNPHQVLVFCLTLILASIMLLWLAWDTSYTLVSVSFFILGLGTGPMFANTLLWLDQFIPVETKTAGFLQSSGALGMLLSGLIFGPYVEIYPQIFLYFFTIYLGALFFTFGFGFMLALAVQKQRKEVIEQLNAEHHHTEP